MNKQNAKPSRMSLALRFIALFTALSQALAPMPAQTDTLSIARSPNGGVRIHFDGAPGRAVRIESSADPSSGGWLMLTNQLIPASGVVELPQLSAKETSEFFRAVVSNVTTQKLTAPEDHFSTFTLDGLDLSDTPSNLVTMITTLPTRGTLHKAARIGNADFSQGGAGWSNWVAHGQAEFDFNYSLPAFGTASPAARVRGTNFFTGGIYRPVTLVVGQTYRFQFQLAAFNDTPFSLEVLLGTTPPAPGQRYGGLGLSNGGEFVAPANEMFLAFQIYSPVNYAGIDVAFDSVAFLVEPIVSAPATLNPNQCLAFASGPDENGRPYAMFDYAISNLFGQDLAVIGSVEINVAPTADRPSSPLRHLETAEDTPLLFQIPVEDLDFAREGDTVRLYTDPVPCFSPFSLDCGGFLHQVEDDDVTRGAVIDQYYTLVTNPRGWLMFVPRGNMSGTTVFNPTLEDSYGLRSVGWPVIVRVNPVNDPPTAASRTTQARNSEGYGLIYPFVNDIDTGDRQALEIRLLSLPETGRLMLGGVTPATTNDWLPESSVAWVWYVPVPDDCAAPIPVGTNIASFQYIVRDPAGATAVAREQLDIIDVNVPPVPTWPIAVTNVEDTTFEAATNSPIVIHLDDRDGDRVYFSVVRPPEHGRLYFLRRDETWGFVTSSNFYVLDSFHPGEHPRFFYVPDPDFNTDGGPPDSFSFRIMDWQLNAWRCEPVVKLYVTGVNDPPVAQSDVLTNDMNQALSVTLVANDPEGKLEKVNILSGPNHGTLTGAPPNVLYTPNAGFSGIDAFRFNAVDNAGATSAVATVTIHVIPPCVPPPSGLIHWWRGESNGFDSAGMNHGSLQGGLGFDPGKAGTAFHFDGLDDWFHIKAPVLTTDWTAVFWVNREDSPDASAALLMDSTSALKLEQYGSMNRNVGITQFGVADYTFNYTVPASQWTHLAFVGTGSETTLYVNGVWRDALPISIALPLESLGGPPGDRLKGLVDEITIFERALSSAEIQQLYNGGTAGMCTSSP